jgi:hypothetical protein
MSAIEKPVLSPPVTTPARGPAVQREHAPTPLTRSKWQKFAIPALVVLLAAATVATINCNVGTATPSCWFHCPEAFQSKHLAVPSYVRSWLETALHGSDMQQSWWSSTGVTKPVGN